MKTEIKVGTKVMYAGFPGTVVVVCCWNENLVEVRLVRGTVCVGKSEFLAGYADTYVVS